MANLGTPGAHRFAFTLFVCMIFSTLAAFGCFVLPYMWCGRRGGGAGEKLEFCFTLFVQVVDG